MAVSIYVPTALRNFTGGNESVAVEARSEEHTSELQSQSNLVCRLLLEKKKIERVDVILKRLLDLLQRVSLGTPLFSISRFAGVQLVIRYYVGAHTGLALCVGAAHFCSR